MYLVKLKQWQQHIKYVVIMQALQSRLRYTCTYYIFGCEIFPKEKKRCNKKDYLKQMNIMMSLDIQTHFFIFKIALYIDHYNTMSMC